ncbi:hypothetical protein SB48_HM08orf01199 [Heyndrickxia coagulans]|uniref:Uncharacterized protein n=1 Tax=Heyndrickxia coagulans TaxID=1398 RepID=A0AAN0T3A9_HEYCO|nr:hypothetical protein SB48_HM08orf01199 [Heyndrickxia coagulans]
MYKREFAHTWLELSQPGGDRYVRKPPAVIWLRGVFGMGGAVNKWKFLFLFKK